RIRQLIQQIVLEGRESGEFERKTPLDEAVQAIHLVMRPYINPVQLQYNLDIVSTAPVHLSALILRSLAP
ncbi:AcrR family transcriptional regulator, partial [Pseudomonas syringae pv. syringae FF5]